MSISNRRASPIPTWRHNNIGPSLDIMYGKRIQIIEDNFSDFLIFRQFLLKNTSSNKWRKWKKEKDCSSGYGVRFELPIKNQVGPSSELEHISHVLFLQMDFVFNLHVSSPYGRESPYVRDNRLENWQARKAVLRVRAYKAKPVAAHGHTLYSICMSVPPMFERVQM